MTIKTTEEKLSRVLHNNKELSVALATWNRYETFLRNSGISKVRIQNLFFRYQMVCYGMNKAISNATRDEIDAFVTDLHNDKITNLNGKKYAGETKGICKAFLKQFFKWFKGDNEFYPNEVRWIKTKVSKDDQAEEKAVINQEEAMKIATRFTKIEQKILTLILFDSGFRIQEALSLKKRNITWEEYDEGDSCFWVECTKSKTERRKVPVPLFTPDLQTYFNSASFLSKGNDDDVFPFSYNTYAQVLKKHGKAIVNKNISPHALRHSSATFYAREFDGNMQLIAERFGWSFSSKQLKVYIRRSGAYQKRGVKKVFSNELSKMKKENTELTERLAIMEKKFQKIQEHFINKQHSKLP